MIDRISKEPITPQDLRKEITIIRYNHDLRETVWKELLLERENQLRALEDEERGN